MASWVKAAIDVPADAVNATTGTGKNLGFFGQVDKGLDPRSPGEGNWAKPSEATDGLSGASAAVTGVTAHSLGQVVKGGSNAFQSSDAVPWYLKPVLGNSSGLAALVVGVVALVLLGPLLESFAAVAGE